MTAELVPVTDQEVVLAQGVSALREWAESARAAAGIAVSLAGTDFVSKPFRGKPEAVTAAILTGAEMGLSPMASLRAIDIIDGNPAMRAHALRGLVQAHGHDVWVEESTTTRAIVCGQRKGSTHTERVVWTMDRASTAGLAGKSNWRAHPQSMLVARATSEVCRLIAADVLLGVPYAVEELEDGATAVPATPPKPRTAKRAPIPEPELPAEPLTDAEPEWPAVTEPPVESAE